MMLSELLEKMQSEIKKCRQAAREEGLTPGAMKGKAAGRAEAASCQRAGLPEMLALKFGEIPAEWQEYIEKLDSPEHICNLTIAVLTTHLQAEYKQLLLTASASYCDMRMKLPQRRSAVRLVAISRASLPGKAATASGKFIYRPQ